MSERGVVAISDKWVQHYEEALFYENRGYIEKAQEHYDYLYANQSSLQVDKLERMCSFYVKRNTFDRAYLLAKLGIQQGGSLTTLLPLFLSSFELGKGEIGDLDALMYVHGIEYFVAEMAQIATLYIKREAREKAYAYLLRCSPAMDRLFIEQPNESPSYIIFYLLLTSLEYEHENYNQARFHLRKLLYLESGFLSSLESIMYWSIVLDEVEEWVKRIDFEEIYAQLKGEGLEIIRFFADLMKGEWKESTIEAIKNQIYASEALEHKRRMCIRLIHKVQKREDWLEGIQEDLSQYPHDLLTMMLYGSFLETHKPNESIAYAEKRYGLHSDKAESIHAYWKQVKEKRITRSTLPPNTKITFLGGGEKIGGMSILVTINGNSILLDAGMHVRESNYHPDYTPMLEQGIGFEDIDALFITHAHLDHTGAVPYMYKQNPNLSMYATEATRRLMKILLLDSVKEQGNQTNGFNEDDVRMTVMGITAVTENQTFIVPSKEGQWIVTYYPSGHILGACAIHIERDGLCILFTGDYSIDPQHSVSPLSFPPDLIVDVLITESTYGFLPTNASINRAKQECMFMTSLVETLKQGGNILIPAFSVGRSQEILMIIRKYFKDEHFLPFDLYIDGRVVDVCEVYEDIFVSQGEGKILLGEEVLVANKIYSNNKGSTFDFHDFYEDYLSKGGNCIISSSGMLKDFSSSARYAEKMIDHPQNSIVFTGYMDEESPGHHIIEQDRRQDDAMVMINGKSKILKAKVDTFRLSAHASREQILKVIIDTKPKYVFLVHGEHQKSYKEIHTMVNGHVIYPTLLDLLRHLSTDINVTPVFNGQSYLIES
ncbi:MBL fold metallo-hydrolase [Paenibacillus sp. NPDC057934]|uniref:MBL fold metallo-hydrolase n=1 Tax=Paenibacillus sp. NPDC057934 TaxID=3346282 RepID=UPI0036DF96B7